jgi:tetratricopeptide (TPR) repeat protein
MAFACERTVLLDGQIIHRNRISDEHPLRNRPEARETVLLTMMTHEIVHIREGHVPESMRESNAEALRYVNSGKVKEAHEILVRIVKMCPAFVDAIDHLAIAERHIGNPEKALRLYHRSLSIKSNGVVALSNIISVLLELRRQSDAEAAAVNLQRMIPDDPEGPFWLGIIALNKPNFPDAMDHFSLARQLYLKRKDERVIHADVFLIKALEGAGLSFARAMTQLSHDCTTYSVSPLTKRYCTSSK